MTASRVWPRTICCMPIPNGDIAWGGGGGGGNKDIVSGPDTLGVSYCNRHVMGLH